MRERLLPWVAQPQEAAPLNALLRASDVWVGDSYWQTLIRGGATSAPSGGVAPGVTGQGPSAVLTNGTGNRLVLASERRDAIPDGNSCTIAVLRRSLDTTARDSFLFGSLVSNFERVITHAPYSDGNLYWDYGNSTSGSGRVSVAFTKKTSWETLVFYAGSRGREVWRDGVRIVNNTSATASLSYTTASSFHLGAATGAAAAADSEEVALVVIAGGIDWTPDECRDWGLDPWGATFEPQRIGVPVSAGGGAYTLTADSGTYTLTGQSAGLQRGQRLAADAGSYTHTGQPASMALSRALVADAGAYTFTGVAAILACSRLLTADAGAYSLTGQAAGLIYTPAGSYALTADAGSYSLGGQAVNLQAARRLVADAGAYAHTGQVAGISKTSGYTLSADAGSYGLNGQAAGFARTLALQLDAGAYALAGQVAALRYSGEATFVREPAALRLSARPGAAALSLSRPRRRIGNTFGEA